MCHTYTTYEGWVLSIFSLPLFLFLEYSIMESLSSDIIILLLLHNIYRKKYILSYCERETFSMWSAVKKERCRIWNWKISNYRQKVRKLFFNIINCCKQDTKTWSGYCTSERDAQQNSRREREMCSNGLYRKSMASQKFSESLFSVKFSLQNMRFTDLKVNCW